MWSGISATVMTMISLGARCVVLAAEKDPEAREMAEANMSDIVHIEWVEEITASMLESVCKRRNFSSIMLGGLVSMLA